MRGMTPTAIINATALLFLTTTFLFSCKPRSDTKLSEDKVQRKPELVKLDLEEKGGSIRTLYLGVIKPDGTMLYIDSGMDQFTAIMANILRSTKIGASFLTQLNLDTDIQASNESPWIRTELPEKDSIIFEFGRTQTTQISRNMLTYQFRSESLMDIGLLPPVLKNRGVELDSFMWPHDDLKPEFIRRQRDQFYKTKQAKSYFDPILSLNDFEFEFMMREYEKVYSLPLFKLIREEVKKDMLYSRIAENYTKSSEAALETIVGLILGAACPIKFEPVWMPANAGYLFNFNFNALARNGLKSAALTLFLMAGKTFLAKRLKEARMGSDEIQAELRKKYAFEIFGSFGTIDQEKKEISFKKLETSWAKNLGKFFNEPTLKGYLLDPRNYYNIDPMVTAAEKGEGFWRTLQTKKTAPERLKVLKDRITLNTQSPEDEKLLNDVLLLGVMDPLFSELISCAIQHSDRLVINIDPNPKAYILGSHTGGSTINLSGYLISAPDDKKPARAQPIFLLMTLAHELWHTFKKDFISAEKYSFANSYQFAQRVNVDETFANLVAIAVQRNVLKKTSTFQSLKSESIKIFLDLFDAKLSVYDPDKIKESFYQRSLVVMQEAYFR